MKKFLAFTTSLCAAVCAFGFGGAAAFAETGEANETVNKQFYPDTFEISPEFESLDDYAVGNGEYLFLQDGCIYKYGNERVTTYENKDIIIQALYFEGSEFYYETDDDKVYALKNFQAALKNFYSDENPEIKDVNTKKTEDILLPNKYNYFLNNGAYYFLDKNNPSTPAVPLDFDNIKLYGKTVYAVQNNVLYTLNGTVGTKVKVKNFELTAEIEVGGALEKLTASSEQTDLKFVRLTDGAYVTEVKLDKLTEDSVTFDTGNTVKVKFSETPTALLLYTAGDKTLGISIIAVNGKSYLIHPKDTEDITVHPLKDTEFKEGTATEGYLYSAPYESVGTRIAPLPYGTSVTIVKEIKKAETTELDHDFYYVEYRVDEETTYKGYVRAKLISTFVYNEAPPVATADPEKTQEDLVKPVVLVLIVLLLIAIAAGYLIYVGTSDKRKKKNEAASTDATERKE